VEVVISEGAREDLRREGVGSPEVEARGPGPGMPERRVREGVECDIGGDLRKREREDGR